MSLACLASNGWLGARGIALRTESAEKGVRLLRYRLQSLKKDAALKLLVPFHNPDPSASFVRDLVPCFCHEILGWSAITCGSAVVCKGVNVCVDPVLHVLSQFCTDVSHTDVIAWHDGILSTAQRAFDRSRPRGDDAMSSHVDLRPTRLLSEAHA
jgi:hypothetical protein